MNSIIVSIFVVAFFFIVIEQKIKIDKLIPALIMMALMWALIAISLNELPLWFDSVSHSMISDFYDLKELDKLNIMQDFLLHHFGQTCEILFFLIGAMAIIEIIDHFDGFISVKHMIKSKTKVSLLWVVCCLAFILSSIIDNLTTTIILITLLRKLVADKHERMWFVGLVIIAANAGGAWSPIGDVTTTMLWIGDKTSTLALINNVLLPSIICMIIPTFIASFLPAFKGQCNLNAIKNVPVSSPSGILMLCVGLFLIICVPVFKVLTHLPPYMGVMLALGIMCFIAETVTNYKTKMTSIEDQTAVDVLVSPTFTALKKIELPSILVSSQKLLAAPHGR